MSSFDDVKTEKNAKINVTFPQKKKKKNVTKIEIVE